MLHDGLSVAATSQPKKIAICESSHSISYAALDAISKDLAEVLSGFDINSSPLILIYAERTAATIASFYGVLRSGGACVPLDPTAPLDRQRFVARDTRSSILISDEPGVARALEIAKASGIPILIAFERVPGAGAECGTWRINYACRNDSPPALYQLRSDSMDGGARPAYVLYTSGSTGRPKGVVLSHGNMECFVDWATGYFNLDSTDVLASHAPLYFDMSIFDIFAAAKACATLCLIPKGISQFPASLGRYVENKGITTLYCVPSSLVKWIRSQAIVRGLRGTLKRLLYAGEPFPMVHLRQLVQAVPDASIYNLYGPTETNVITCYKLEPQKDLQSASIPIGSPCPYAEILIVDGNKVVTLPGNTGELVVRGKSLMVGYLRGGEQTISAVRPNGFGNNESAPYYRTGDLVEILDDRQYRFIARNDRLVKVGGYRIEMGEIEHVVMELDEIEECVCVPDNSNADEIGLTAFVTLVDKSFQIDLIRDYLRHRLPGYMIPGRIISLDSIPRTATGKCDRNELATFATRAV